jgi:CIC family chloride channel protein
VRERWATRLEQVIALGRRSRQVVLLSALTGLATGAAVAFFDWLVADGIFERLLRQPRWVQGAAPLAGLLLAAALLRWLAAGATPATSDDYIRNFHDRHARLDERPFLGRVSASVATLGLGGALGYEGPAIYIGAAIGSGIQRRLSRYFSRDDAKLLLVAGAAAGVAAIFKAPATGAVFALEVPYQDDLARRMLLPALTAAAVSYVTFVSFNGTTPLLPVRGAPPFDLRDLGGAAVLGLLCGFGARGFSFILRHAKAVAARAHPAVRVAVAGALLAGFYAAAEAMAGEGLTLGPGYHTVMWAIDPHHGLDLIVGMFFLRAAATTATVAGGGVGGLFIPLVIQGVLAGRAVGGLFGAADSSLFPVIGIAAFLGAGYRVPLAAVMFVAESTGRPAFVVPGLIAAAVAQLAMGRSSVSPYQVAARAGHLERRFSLPISAALQSDVPTVPPDTTVREFFALHLVGTRQKSVPVVDGSHRYLGMARVDELGGVEEDRWETTPVERIMRDDLPTAQPGWTLREAVVAMQTADVDRLSVIDGEGRFVGVVSTSEILKLDEILDAQSDTAGG